MFTLKVDNTFISNMHMIDLSKMLSIANGYFAIQAINEHACMDLLNVIYHNVCFSGFCGALFFTKRCIN